MRTELARWIEQFGWPGVIGLALIVFATTLHFSALVPLAAQRANLRTEAETLQARLKAGESIAKRPAASVGEQLGTFYAFFPKPDTTAEWIGRINAAARAKGLTLASGEYKLERRADHKLARYQMTLPVTGTYTQIREFVGAVLADVPAAALDEITLRRDAVTSATLEARIRLSLWLGDA
jgi:Tfp pilus assembly protein PilO